MVTLTSNENIIKLNTLYALFYLIFFSNTTFGQNILPTPTEVKISDSNFSFNKSITIAYNEPALETAKYLQNRLKNYVETKLIEANEGNIILSFETTTSDIGNEGYNLNIKNNGIKIVANNEAGFFYGVQSLLQLLPIEVQAEKPFDLTEFVLKGIEIKDIPNYGWRSFMLDSGRQYQTPDFIKRYLDYMAMLKMNVFHWHLTEGQGWRIELKKYPKLTEIGSKIADGEEQQGFYTQDQIRDIVSYAKKLHIIV
jgi:hexosaminidase